MAERAKAAAAKADADAAKEHAAASSGVYGELPLVQSRVISGRTWARLADLSAAVAGSTVLVRARLFVTRETGKVLFITLRQGTRTAQAVVLKADNKDMFKWATSACARERARHP